MEKNHTSARNATKTSVAETSQQWRFYVLCFYKKQSRKEYTQFTFSFKSHKAEIISE